MNAKTIYIDFDGVLVDTPKFIKSEIQNKKNHIEILEQLPWNYFLNNCSEINDNIKFIKDISKKVNIVILTHVYSQNEANEKKKYIEKYMNEVDIITVPYYISKNEAVSAKGNILIDDFNKNITSWNNAGGIGIKFDENEHINSLLANYIF